jgi:hypothetical protein
MGRELQNECFGIKKETTFQPHYGPGVDSASNGNEYQESSGGKGQLVHNADNLTAICKSIV